jgi:hypothetical protein
MPLAIITPTRDRFEFLAEQATLLAPQLGPDDLWLIGCDNSPPRPTALATIGEIVPRPFVVWMNFEYTHESTVDRVANALVAFALPAHDIVEVDDHDPLSPDTLSEIRHAFEAGHDYVFGWHEQRIQIEAGADWERWPTVERDYTPGAFARHEYDAIGLRAVRRSLWDRLGGRDSERFPFGHYDLAVRAEAAGASIVCLQKALCAVTVEPQRSICGQLRRW